MPTDLSMAEVAEAQRVINEAKHPLSCSLWTSKVCSCEAQARAVLELRSRSDHA